MHENAGRGVDRRWLWWVGLGLAVTLLMCSLPVVLAVTVVNRLPDLIKAGSAGAAVPSPRPGDPESVTAAWLGDQVAKSLDRQADALLRGDRAAFLAVAYPHSPAVTVLKREFAALRALRVKIWQPRVWGTPRRVGDQWQVTVTVEHCFVVADCAVMPVMIGTMWADVRPEPKLVEVKPFTSPGDGPRPWEVSELVAAFGKRTMVATTPAFRDRLSGLLVDAEHAAAIADRYAIDGTPPKRYRIFYAGKDEWRRWYGGDHPSWTAGYSVSVGGGQFDVVVNSQDLARTFVDDLLRHELTHVSSLSGTNRSDKRLWWFVEGLAEYAVSGGTPVRRYDGLPDVRRLIDAGGWTGQLDTLEPAPRAADWEVSARYGIGYLAVRHLIERFGEQAVLEFFDAVVRDGRPVGQTVKRMFGEDWTVLQDECVSYVRDAVA